MKQYGYLHAQIDVYKNTYISITLKAKMNVFKVQSITIIEITIIETAFYSKRRSNLLKR